MVTLLRIEDEFRVKCTECNYARLCGAAKLNAYRLARKHAESRVHKVAIQRLKLDYMWTPNEKQRALFPDMDVKDLPF